MKTIEIEVVSQHYIGPLAVKPVKEDYSLFSVYLKDQFLGRMQPIKKQDLIVWYSSEITDRELVDQIGEWIEASYPLNDQSFKKTYRFKFFFFLIFLLTCLVCLIYWHKNT